MGDSAVYCAMSGMSIRYTDVALIALAPKGFLLPSRNRPARPLGARDGSETCLKFTPLMLPIFGQYDGYGGIEKIERNEHVEFLEKRFGEPIDNIAEAITMGQAPSRTKKAAAARKRGYFTGKNLEQIKWDGIMSGCFVARPVWDKFKAYHIDDCGYSERTAWERGTVDLAVLFGMGFRFQRSEGQRLLRHTFVYVHSGMPEVEVRHVYGTNRVLVSVQGRELPAITLQELHALCPFPPEALAWAKKSTNHARVVAEAQASVLESRHDNRRRQALYEDKPEYVFHVVKSDPWSTTWCDSRQHATVAKDGIVTLEKCKLPGACSDLRLAEASMLRPTHEELPAFAVAKLKEAGWKYREPRSTDIMYGSARHYFDQFAPEMRHIYNNSAHIIKFGDRLAELLTFSLSMHAVARPFVPSFSGPQYGHPWAQCELSEMVVAEMSKRIARETEDAT